MENRTILTFATGASQYRTMAKALAITLRLHGSAVDRTIFTDVADDRELSELYHLLLPPPDAYSHWFMKLAGLEATAYDQILFIDGDGLAIRNIDPVFDELTGSDCAVQGQWLAEPGDWYGDIGQVMAREGVEAIPKFSGGFLFYERTERAKELIRVIMDYAARYDDLGLRRNGGKVVDEVCIALAMAKTKIGRVVSDSHHNSTTPWRRVGAMRLDVVAGECSFMRMMPGTGLELASPVIYHSAMAKWDIQYWREVRKLLRAYRTEIAPNMGDDLSARWKRKLRRVFVEVYRRMAIRD